MSSKKMNIIQALQAMKNGKKVRQIGWIKKSYIYLKDGLFYSTSGEYSYYNLSSLEEDKWEEYISVEVDVKLNDEHTAKITKEGVKVGCQSFSLDKVEELYKAVQKVKNES